MSARLSEASVVAPAKVNLFLHVGAKRPDGYHDICSLAAFADVGDRLDAIAAAELSLAISGPFATGLANGDDNLVMRAGLALQAWARGKGQLPGGARLMLEKNLPIASGIGGGVSPGEVIALYDQDLGPTDVALGAFDSAGILSSQVGTTQVLFDGKAAPLLYSLAGQVSAIVPYSVAGKTSTQVQVIYNGQKSAIAAVNVVDAAPALFNFPGVSQAVAQNSDFSLNNSSNPASTGSIVVLYGTGEGATNPGGVDGKQATDLFPAPILPVTVTIGGQKAEVLYSGAAPFLVAGVMQLNVRIPAGVASGPAAVVVTVGTRPGTGTSTVAVR